MLVKELRGTESTQDACAKMRVKHSLTHFTSAAISKDTKVPFLTSFAEMWEHVGIGKKKLRQSDPCGIFSQTGTQSLSALTLTRTYTNLKYHDCG